MKRHDAATGETATSEHVGAYIADMAAQLHGMALAGGLTVLACVLNLASAEAERIARDAKAQRLSAG